MFSKPVSCVQGKTFAFLSLKDEERQEFLSLCYSFVHKGSLCCSNLLQIHTWSQSQNSHSASGMVANIPTALQPPQQRNGEVWGSETRLALPRALTEPLQSWGVRMWSPLLDVARQSNHAAVGLAEMGDTTMLLCECAVWWGFTMWLKLKCRIVTLDKLSSGRITSEFGNPRMKSLVNPY